MLAKYSLDIGLATLSLAELKRLALIVLKVHETDHKNAKAYYERNRDTCIARSSHSYERPKVVIAAQRVAEI
jgi:hypothetical protein